ncbi:hypothetical protein GCM10009565_38130 [Amycolatopsis albidoflavus]
MPFGAGSVVVASAPVKGLADGTEIGKSQLCRDTAYHYWAFVRFYSPLNSSTWGQATLDGMSGSYTLQAVGEVTSSHTGNVYAQGWTPITR